MTTEAEPNVTAGQAALRAGDWPAARERFAAALEQEESPEALMGLAEALWWLGDVERSAAHRERAYVEFRRRGDAVQAVDCALTLCVHHQANLGNSAAAAGWRARAVRLVDDLGLDEMRGWLLLTDDGGPVEAERSAQEARRLAGECGDVDLELCALASLGSALIRQGRVAEGMAALDEAMAGSLGGEAASFDTVVYTSCNMISSCASCAEFERAVQWVSAADRFTERYGCPFLYVYCRAVYGSVLVATGEWDRAERELTTAIEMARGSLPPLHAGALAGLAQLRLAQGRLEEAERLVAGFEDHAATASVRAAIQLERGEAALAAVTVGRALKRTGADRLERALLLELLGQAESAQGEHATAAGRGLELAEMGAQLGCRAIRARGERLRGQALARTGDADGARQHLEVALQVFAELGMPLEAARTRLLLAESVRVSNGPLARAEAAAALAAFEQLGAGRDADAAAALLRTLGVKAARSGPKGLGTLTKREREVLALVGEGLSNREIADRLYLSRKTVEHHVAHVLAKTGTRSRAEAAAEAVRLAGGSAGE